MSHQIVITEKASQARDVRAAVGGRYGPVLAAEGHLLDLAEPEDVDPAWKRWTPVLLRPEGLYGTKPAAGGNKPAKLRAIRAALRTAGRWAGRCRWRCSPPTCSAPVTTTRTGPRWPRWPAPTSTSWDWRCTVPATPSTRSSRAPTCTPDPWPAVAGRRGSGGVAA